MAHADNAYPSKTTRLRDCLGVDCTNFGGKISGYLSISRKQKMEMKPIEGRKVLTSVQVRNYLIIDIMILLSAFL